MRDGGFLLQSIIRGLDDLVERRHFYFPEFAFEMAVNGLVELPQRFPQLRVEVVLHAVIGSAIHLLRDHRPFVPNLVMQPVQFLLILFRPVFFRLCSFLFPFARSKLIALD